jgi:hypothetical protein
MSNRFLRGFSNAAAEFGLTRRNRTGMKRADLAFI